VNLAININGLRFLVGFASLTFQAIIIFYPQVPMFQRPLHLILAIILVVLWTPLDTRWLGPKIRGLIDTVLIGVAVAALIYYMNDIERLTSRMETIDDVFFYDKVMGLAVILVLLEAVRRVVGWMLLGVILFFVLYAFAGKWFPGWMAYNGFSFEELIEILTMSANGILGITTATSVQFVFYFVAFGAIYSATGGGQLFIDMGMRVSGRYQGGAAKAAIVSSSLMGSISGSAVANVTATGIFTIPLMRRSGYNAETAAATEAIASTGGQLMPPIMGIAAFVMAELLQIPYVRIALAGVIPALAFYFAIFLYVDLAARKGGVGTLTEEDIIETKPILPRIHLLLPPIILIIMLVSGYSATYSAVIASVTAIAMAYVKRENWLGPKDLMDVVRSATRQAAEVAVPIASIGIIISVSIQSNLALKFADGLIGMGGGTLIASMLFVIAGCIIMGMGLPTVAAYIIGAILFVPALLELGIPELSAHFFVMYYCVLSMVTPPVALASYTAAGLARANTWKTSLLAFKFSMVTFLVPFAFAFNPELLGEGSADQVALALVSTLTATGAWSVAFVGYIRSPISYLERGLFAVLSILIIFSDLGSLYWVLGFAGASALFLWGLFLRRLVFKPSPSQADIGQETVLPP
jgi:TRAP transporter 4TM/12TM fusion protein